MKIGLKSIIILIFSTGFLCNITFAAGTRMSPFIIKQYLKTKKAPIDWQKIDENDVDFPIVQILQAYVQDQAIDSIKAINTLEPVMTRTRFVLNRPDADSLRSYFFWRDLMYTILSRSFYENGDAEKSYRYASAVQEGSDFYRTAKLQEIWAGLSLTKYDESRLLLDKIVGSGLNVTEIATTKLQYAYLLLQEKKYQEIITTIESIETSSLSLKAYGNKLLAQAYFELHQLNISDSHEVKKKRLEKILVLIKKIKIREKHNQFAYFAAEVYWAYASLIRIEDPVKYHKQIMAALNTADTYIKPWVQKSIVAKKALLPEEAMFLASIVLWEQDKIEESIPRLLLTIELYPGTQYKEDIYQLIGDYYFEHANYKESLIYYSLLSRSENVEKVSYGIYKAAWAFYNMKEKFKALRHFQRLVLHYKKEKIDVTQTPGTLFREAEIDMFLVMAELLSADESLKELEIFRYSNADWDDVREKMSNTYKKLGKFEESMLVLKDLLVRHSKNENYYTWLYEVLTNQLNLGLRNEIASSIETYLSADQYQGSKIDFENKIINLQLILHREAKKSDDAEIWRATDALYKVISQLAPESQNSDFWYFGAQRKEMKGQAWAAIDWYKKAIAIPGSVNKKDSAISVLRIVQVQITEKSIDKVPKILVKGVSDTNLESSTNPESSVAIREKIQNCKEAALWYIANFSETDERYLANEFYLKALLELKDYIVAEDFILATLEKSHFAEKDWNNYLIYNKNLYTSYEWQAAHNLADRLIKGASVLSAPNDSLLREVRQESAFQLAYQLEKLDDDKGLVRARDWYLKSIELNNNNSNLQVKTWNNLLRSYKLPSEINLLSKSYEKFESEIFAKLTAESILLLEYIYAYVGKAYEDIGYPIKKFEVMLSSSGIASNETQDILRWNALVGFGTHYALEHFNRTLELLNGKNILQDPLNKLTLARLYFLLRNYDKAWASIQDLAVVKTSSPAFFILLRDFYTALESENSPMLGLVQDWLVEKQNIFLKHESILEGIFTRQKFVAILMSFDVKPLKSLDLNPGRSIASVTTKNTDIVSAQNSEQIFNKRLALVSTILVNLVENKQRIRKSFGKVNSQLFVEGICRQSVESQRAIKELELQREPELSSVKWEHFISKLNIKILELEVDANKEVQICDEKKNEIALFDTLKESVSPICSDGRNCPPQMPSSSVEIENVRRESLRKQESTLDLIHNLVEVGAWATAEYYTEQITDPNLKLLSSAYLRIAHNDRKSAMLLLNELYKSPVKSQAFLFSAMLSWSQHATKKTQNLLAEVNASELSSWEQVYLSRMQSVPVSY